MTSERQPAKPVRRGKIVLAVLACLVAAGVIVGVVVPGLAEPGPLPAVDASIHIDLRTAVNEFPGTRALGAGVDGLEEGEIDKVWTPGNVQAMKTAGFGPISYRLRTELGVKAWHWNPRGTWSDAAAEQGYWVSSDEPQDDYKASQGYRLPRRGNTIDQAKNDGYSRLSDGDPATFWKSNPYLDSHFTGEADDLNPQWIMAVFPHAMPIDAVKFDWGTPFATGFKVQYWSGKDAHFPVDNGTWVDFPHSFHEGTGGSQTVRIAPEPMQVQYLRVVLTQDSNTAPAGSTDVRDQLGFAVRELSVGQVTGDGFVDHVVHQPDQQQTEMWTSSTDPWHSAGDIDGHYEHASFERLVDSGITNGQPIMVPAPALYGVPEDAAALVSYLKKRGYPVERVEIGEEPDGQLAQPEHYGALYLQMAKAMKAVDPGLEFGGPGYQTTLPEWVHWPDANGVRSWTGRFVSFLRDRNAMEDFDFFSFEWYPFDDVCADPSAPLAQHPKLLADLLARQEKAGLPADIPKVITEYGYSSFAGQVELELPGAMINAETAAMFLAMGGETSYYYGLEPNWVFQEKEGAKCNSWGNLMMLQFYNDWKIRPLAAFEAARLVNQQWVQAGDGKHTVHTATSDIQTATGEPLVTAYALRRPDGSLGVLLFNKDPNRTLKIRLMHNTDGAPDVVDGKIALKQYSAVQYKWNPTPGEGNGGHPDPNQPAASSIIDADDFATFTLPPHSISVAVTQP
ncbi:MAG: type protein [Pseudarthrobacter sp.]|nr:type protein [Pseudarthrobacter sp.]